MNLNDEKLITQEQIEILDLLKEKPLETDEDLLALGEIFDEDE